ncbi:hypothetical protein [Acinetobacter terrae]|uniref:hypothetical protein n=1 Tax=Acinetobacter terrae TaxID=2731247 RepID=UPI0007D88000|nr:hypothetical protein [Acinetobacter terrae]OAL87735.1 hypothetical protein AY608_10465 [Acinetobacter terrae]
MLIKELPSLIDLRNQQDEEQWVNEVNIKRPWRYAFFDYYAELIQRQKIEIPPEIKGLCVFKCH